MKLCPQCSELYPDEDAGFCPLDGTKLVTSTDPMLGRTISSRYRLVKKLGMGGMAMVYLARHVMIDRLNAIKILRRDLSLDPNQRERFLREARAVNRINHPNIVEITDFGEFEGTAYLVMEYAAGESLLAALKTGPMPWDRVVRIGEQISSALARAHEAGVIHRDLKPENVLLLDRVAQDNVAIPNVDRIKLTDFGIAKIIDAPALTFSEQMFGTPGYIAPEYVEGAKADGRADLFSLGVLMYEAMSGSLPWEAKGQAELLLRPLTTAPTPISQRIEGVPPEVDSLLLSLLAKNPDDRPPDAFVVHDVLMDVLRRYAPSRSTPPPGSSTGRDAIPTTVTEVEAIERPPMSTAEIGRIQTSALASRWGSAIADVETALVRARKKGLGEATAGRIQELATHARSLVEKLERTTASVSETQGRVDRLEAHAREFRANLGRAIDELARDRARERSHWGALRNRHDELEVDSSGAASQREAGLWEMAALSAEEERVKTTEEDITFQIVQLQLQLEAKNERFEKEYAAATGELEGSISAVRAMTHELVRSLDEAAKLASARRPR